MIRCLHCHRPMFMAGGCAKDPCEGEIASREASARFWPGPAVKVTRPTLDERLAKTEREWAEEVARRDAKRSA